MKLVEVVMLVGAHCVSPVEHSHMMTDAAKVQCAVVIEKDTDKGTLSVTPPGAAADPQVAAALTRFDAAPVTTAGTRIVPARAPAGSAATEIKPPPANAAAEAVAAAPPPATDATPGQTVATLAPPPSPTAGRAAEPKKPAVKARATAAPKQPQCKGSAVAKWYDTGDGHRKYRCVNPTGAPAPTQLY